MPSIAVIGARRRRRGNSGPAILVADTFTRANNAASLGSTETGTAGVLAWTAYDSCVWGVTSNQAYLQTAGASESPIAVNTGVADVSVSATFSSVSGTPWVGVCFRLSDGANYLACFWAGGSLYLRKIVAGVANNIGGSPVVLALSGGDTLKVTTSGATIRVTRNGTDIFGAVTDAFNQTATRHGLYALNADTTKLDNFTVTVP